MSKAKVASRTVSSFRLQHVKSVHVPAKINAALVSMQKEHGDEHYEYEDEFAARSGVSLKELQTSRAKFTANVVEAPNIGKKTVRFAWFATTRGASLARKKD